MRGRILALTWVPVQPAGGGVRENAGAAGKHGLPDCRVIRLGIFEEIAITLCRQLPQVSMVNVKFRDMGDLTSSLWHQRRLVVVAVQLLGWNDHRRGDFVVCSAARSLFTSRRSCSRPLASLLRIRSSLDITSAGVLSSMNPSKRCSQAESKSSPETCCRMSMRSGG